MKLFWRMLMAAMWMCIVDPGEGGGGGADDPGEPGGADAGGTPGASGDGTQSQADGNGEAVHLSKAEFDQIAQMGKQLSGLLQERAINTAVSDIQSRIPEFDLKKVHDHLVEMKKTNPTRASNLNNADGWEMLWKSEIAETAAAKDPVSGGRHVSGESNRDDLANRINRGEGTLDDQAAYYAKYFQ